MSGSKLRPGHRARIDTWRAACDYVAIGNLGEQVSAQLLTDLGYLLLAAQDDLMGGVSNILDEPSRMNAEDFTAVDPEGRLLTVNSKASVSPRASRVLADGNLKAPRLGRQGEPGYYSARAGLVSPLDDGAQTYAQVLKVDLVNLLAQLFEIELDGRLTPVDKPVDVCGLVERILDTHPGRIPPPAKDDFS